MEKMVALSFCIHGLSPWTHTLPGMVVRDVPFSQTGHDISFCTFNVIASYLFITYAQNFQKIFCEEVQYRKVGL